jgi:hypothetical protein
MTAKTFWLESRSGAARRFVKAQAALPTYQSPLSL